MCISDSVLGIFLIRETSILCKIESVFENKKVYHIGVHIAKSNRTFQQQWLEFFGVVKYCLLC